MNYRKGDFVRIINPKASRIDRLRDKDVNIFRIGKIQDDSLLLESYQDSLSTADIEPIPIDGKSDFQIYYDPITAGSIVPPGAKTPTHRRNYEYYYDRFRSCSFEEKDFQQLIIEKGLKYVHEVQHFLIDNFQNDGLKINLY